MMKDGIRKWKLLNEDENDDGGGNGEPSYVTSGVPVRESARVCVVTDRHMVLLDR
jgi:hypothetical protein